MDAAGVNAPSRAAASRCRRSNRPRTGHWRSSSGHRPRIGIRRVLEIGIVEIDVGEAVARRRQVHQPASRLHQRGNAVDEHEMAEMVGAELRLEPVRGLTRGQAMTPALAMTMSKAAHPRAAHRRRRARWRARRDRVRPVRGCRRRPWLRLPVGRARALPRSRAAPTTSAPCAASARAVSTPSPAETPVTRTRLPLRSTPASTSSVVDVAPKSCRS